MTNLKSSVEKFEGQIDLNVKFVKEYVDHTKSKVFKEGDTAIVLKDLPNDMIKVIRKQEPHDIVTLHVSYLEPCGLKYFPLNLYYDLISKHVKCMEDYTPTEKNQVPLLKGEIVKIISRGRMSNRAYFYVQKKDARKGYAPYNWFIPYPVEDKELHNDNSKKDKLGLDDESSSSEENLDDKNPDDEGLDTGIKKRM